MSDNADAHRELAARLLGLPPGLELEWLGVAGYRLTYEGHSLLLDPFVSRVPLGHLLRRKPTLPERALIDRYIPPAGTTVAVLVGHTHWDHAVDAPAIAARERCPVLGSRSMARLMGLHGLAELAVEVEPHRSYELGPFTVHFVPSRHSKLVLGLAVPFDGELSCSHLDGLCPSAYRCGQVWGIHIEVAGTTLYHQGSADLIDEEVRDRDIDVFLAGVAGRGVTRRYWERILGRLRPRTVVASHYDDFFRPLGAPMGFIRGVKLDRVPEEIARVSTGIEVAALPEPAAPGPPLT